ncbi:MAG: hypothetical protein JWM75_1473 [Sphingomonas bacterium]|nr:hypothetical protein [Sphingomonas bacterium]
MNKREFLKASGASLIAAVAVATPAVAAALPRRRIAIIQSGLPGADAFATRERAAGARIMAPVGDPVRWYRDTLAPALQGAEVTGFTDPIQMMVMEGSLRESGYVRASAPVRTGRATAWSAVPRSA